MNLVALFDWTLRSSLGAACVALVVGLVVGCLGRRLPPLGRYWLWSLVVLRLLVPMVPGASWSPFNWLPLSDWSEPAPRLNAAGLLASAGPSKPVESSTTSQEPVAPALEAISSRAHDQTQVSRGSGGATRPDPASTHAWPWTAAAALWLAGALGYFLFVLIQHWQCNRHVARARAASEERLLRLLAACRQTAGVRQEIKLLLLEGLSSPAVFGWWRPCLLLPKSVAVEFTDRELAHIFLHELVHVRRGDVLLNWFWIFLQAWHWFNPLLWLALRRLRTERELVCDAAVLSVLGPAEHTGYGATLLRLVLTEALPTPSLAPVLTRQDNLERRIRMIKEFTPKSRRALLATAMLTIVLAGWTFTRAANPAPAEPAAVGAAQAAQAAPVTPLAAGPSAAEPKKMAPAQRERRIQVLEKEMAKLRALTQEQKDRLDQLKVKLAIAEADEQPGSSAQLSSEILRSLEKARMEAEAEHARMSTLFSALTNAARSELRQMMTTAVPDSHLERLLEQRANVEQKLAQMIATLGANHAEVQGQVRQQEILNRHIDQRLEGMLAGLKIALDAKLALTKTLRRQIEVSTQQDIAKAIERRPYHDLKRELETQLYLLDRLQGQLLQERLEATMEEQ